MKSIVLKGKLGAGSTIDYVLTPNTEFTSGNWTICVNSVAYNCEQVDINEASVLMCNFSRAQLYSSSSQEVTNYQQPFGLIQLKTGKTTVSLSNFFISLC